MAPGPTTSVPTRPGDVAELFAQEHRSMVRLAGALVGDAEAAQEVVQEAFLRVHRRWASVDEPAAYLRVAVVSAAKNHHRTVSRSDRRLLRARAVAPTSTDLGASDLGDALRALPFPQRAALALRFYAGLPDDEIAALLGCRSATVRSHVRRGLAALREVIEP